MSRSKKPVVRLKALAGEGTHSQALVFSSARNYCPKVFERLLGPHDVVTHCEPFREMKDDERRFSEVCVPTWHDIFHFTTVVHEWPTLVVVTDHRTRHPDMVFETMVNIAFTARRDTVVSGRLNTCHIHIDANRSWQDFGQVHSFPEMSYSMLQCGCLDPRLCQCRARACNGQRTAWLAFPAALRAIVEGPHHHREWLKSQIQYAVLGHGTKKVEVRPHEDCRGHPVEGETENSEQAMRERLRIAQAAIKELYGSNRRMRSVKFRRFYEKLGEQRLTVSRQSVTGEQMIVEPGTPLD